MNIKSIKRLVKEYNFSALFFTDRKSIGCDSCRHCEYFDECHGYECCETGLFCTLTDFNEYDYTYIIIDENMYYIKDYKNNMILKE